jgi:hypothetical protein
VLKVTTNNSTARLETICEEIMDIIFNRDMMGSTVYTYDMCMEDMKDIVCRTSIYLMKFKVSYCVPSHEDK